MKPVFLTSRLSAVELSGEEDMAVATTPVRRGVAIKPLHVVGLGIILLAVVYGFFGFRMASVPTLPVLTRQ